MKILLVVATWFSLFSSAFASTLAVPLVRQSTDYSCGAASLLGVLAYYGKVDWNETELMKALATDTENGTPIRNIVAFSQSVGLRADLKLRMTLEDLEVAVRGAHPVIAAFQAWASQSEKHSYAEDWDNGHYSVVVGLDDKDVILMDPVQLGSLGTIPRTEFLTRWHDLDQNNEKLYQAGVVISGNPSPPPFKLETP